MTPSEQLSEEASDAADEATDQLVKNLEALQSSRALVLVLSKHVLERPWVIVEVYEALSRRMPIVCVNIAGGGYDYAQASRYLANLEEELEDDAAEKVRELRTVAESVRDSRKL